MKMEYITHGIFALLIGLIAGTYNHYSDEPQENETESVLNINNEQQLPTISALSAYQARTRFRRSEKFKNVSQVEGINLSRSVIEELNNNLDPSFLGFRLYYGEIDEGEIAILYPLDSNGKELAELSSYSYTFIDDKSYITPCPPLCD